ncbi:hypothetical protein [Geobacter sulfurreducens]|uniref:hypothetical protein n=1 Tax=Geobacter sulfurreducens TaxID=35554 RepID=UPI0020B8AAF5|nr:hypothetical protein [Geobacter sulfurreducens]UTG91822.1 hypothetical protein J8622_12395 [Geobacter sulfurreducens]
MLKILLCLIVLQIISVQPSFAEEADRVSTSETRKDVAVPKSTPQSFVTPSIKITLDAETRQFLAEQSGGMGIKDWVIACIGLFGALLGATIGGRYTRKATIHGVTATFNNELLKKQRLGLENKIALLQSIFDEITALHNIFQAGSGGTLITINTEAKNINERFFRNYFAASCNYFCIYDSCAQQIGSFDNEDLRAEIITTYTMSKSLVDSLLLYNQPLHNLDNWRIFNINHQYYLQIFEEYVLCLVQNTKRLQAQATELKAKVENLKISLRGEIECLNKELAGLS